MPLTQSQPVDANFKPVAGGLPFIVKKSVTFTNGADENGDYDGAGNPQTLFTVTGDVLLFVIGIVKTALTGDNATIEVGVTGGVASLIPQATGTDLAVNIGWHDASPSLGEGFTPQWHPVGGGLDIIQTIGTADVTAGAIDYYCFFRPLSSDGDVVAA